MEEEIKKIKKAIITLAQTVGYIQGREQGRIQGDDFYKNNRFMTHVNDVVGEIENILK